MTMQNEDRAPIILLQRDRPIRPDLWLVISYLALSALPDFVVGSVIGEERIDFIRACCGDTTRQPGHGDPS